MTLKEKLKGFPKIYGLSLTEGIERRNKFEQQCSDLGLDYHSFVVDRYPHCGTVIVGNLSSYLPEGQDFTTLAVTANHIKMIKLWLDTTDDDMAVFAEDDISFETIEHWTFSWDNLMTIIPEDFNAVQLCLITDRDYDLTLMKRDSHHWGANCYLIKRDFAQWLIDTYTTDIPNVFDFTLSHEPASYNPCLPEDILFVKSFGDYVTLDGFYTLPLLIESRDLSSFLILERIYMNLAIIKQ